MEAWGKQANISENVNPNKTPNPRWFSSILTWLENNNGKYSLAPVVGKQAVMIYGSGPNTFIAN
mgnify:CR=1 FL=1